MMKNHFNEHNLQRDNLKSKKKKKEITEFSRQQNTLICEKKF